MLRETDDFGYWMTYTRYQSSIPASKRLSRELIDANIQKHLGGPLNSGLATRDVPRFMARMHLSRFPVHYTVTVLTFTDKSAVERVRWQMRDGHGPRVRLTWTPSVIGWPITGATYLGIQ